MAVPAAPDQVAPAVQVFGPALVSVSTFYYQAGESDYYPLGYTRNGVDQTEEAFWLDVPGDEHGGDDGPPIDIQFLGGIVRVRSEFTKWNVNNVNMVRGRVEDSGAGTPVIGEGYIPCKAIGSLQIAGQSAFALRIRPSCTVVGNSYYQYFFPIAIPRAPIELNHATKFATVVMEFECHRVPSSDLYNPGLLYLHSYFVAT